MKKRTLLILCGVVFLLVAVFCLAQVIRMSYSPKASRTEAFRPVSAEEEYSATGDIMSGRIRMVKLARVPSERYRSESDTSETSKEEISSEDKDVSEDASEEPEETPYVSPIDFETLQEINPDIYGWLEIDNCEISYPIVQNEEDDTFYLDHNTDKEYSAAGAIFSESEYNKNDLSDPVTILYGHHMLWDTMFSNLQKLYTDDEFFEENPTFTIYTPEAELTYGVFAAVPYPGEHILYYYDFEDEAVFTGFFEGIMSTRDLSANFNEVYAPEPDDHVVILSTCLVSNNTNRFLVMGTLLTDDQSDISEISEERR